MNEIAALLEIGAYAAAVLLPPILLHRLASSADWPGLEAVFRIPLDEPLPRGVHEEDVVPWRVEALSRRGSPSSRASS